jgi:asparagine synthase (glutamine-hydrolysing)
MCGINGIFSIGSSLPPNCDELIRIMNRVLLHRGPDDEGVFIDHASGLALGHRRLSIIDLSISGHQPMRDGDNNQIVFNGEIYNFKEIKKNIVNTTFHSSSDTEVLMSLLANEGHSCLNQLNGMFAFAWFNSSKNELFLARDRAGKKPLYYHIGNGLFSFSSEIKALLTLPWIKNETDHQALYHFITFNQLDAPLTMFKNIYKLAPAESLLVGKTGVSEKQIWWKPTYMDISRLSEKEISDNVYHNIAEAVNQRMVADVPVGAFLSGGVDSSAVVALMRQYTANSIKTYSVGFDGQPDYDERIYADKISKMFQTEHHEKIICRNDIESYLHEVVNAFDEPLADATAIPIWFISKLARENGTIVVQTGDGADELFAGYRNWQKYNQVYPLFHSFTALPKAIRKGFELASQFMNESSPMSELIHRGVNNQELFWGGAKSFKENSKKQFLRPEWLEKIANKNSYSIIEKHKNNFNELRVLHPQLTDIDWMCYLGFHFQIPNKYLYRMDKLGMANSIEIRNPFLDYNLINLALSIPANLKIKNGEPKYILKKSLEKILPHEILYRKKMGFCVPLKEWAGDLMIDFIANNMNDFCDKTQIFNKAGLKYQLEEIKKGNKHYTNNLWTIYFLMAWFKRWM